jgi:hypothetical protein
MVYPEARDFTMSLAETPKGVARGWASIKWGKHLINPSK